jgi:hypothetical protein
MHQTLRNSSAYHIALAVRIVSELNVEALHRTLQALLDRHESLRTTFFLGDDGELRQRVSPMGPVAFEKIDSSGWTEERLKVEVGCAYARPFDLDSGPLFRAHLFAGRAGLFS